MAFYLFSMPEKWPGWLVVAIQAEKLAIKEGLDIKQARDYLYKQNPIKVVEFVRRFEAEDLNQVNVIMEGTKYGSLTGQKMKKYYNGG